jgi:hypothetical protein
MKTNSNVQIPMSKQYQITQSSRVASRVDFLVHFGHLILRDCLEFGAWDLDFPAGFNE